MGVGEGVEVEMGVVIMSNFGILLTHNYLLFTAYCLLLTTYYLLLATCYLLLTTYYSLLTNSEGVVMTSNFGRFRKCSPPSKVGKKQACASPLTGVDATKKPISVE